DGARRGGALRHRLSQGLYAALRQQRRRAEPAAEKAVTAAGPAVRLRGVTKVYDGGVAALGPLDLAIARGAFVSLLGPSGCGKSTALRLIAGLALPSSGTVEVVRAAAPGAIGFVFQEPTLMPWASVRDNVYLPLRLAGVA